MFIENENKYQGAEPSFLMAQWSAIKFVHTLQHQKAQAKGTNSILLLKQRAEVLEQVYFGGIYNPDQIAV